LADLSKEQLRQLAAMGAQARLEELRNEEAAIRQAFPELGRKSSSSPAAAAAADVSAPAAKRSRMSAAARRAVSERMKKYWADRRKAKNAKK
jgi:aspartate aminotransferase-like enzyme